MTSYFKGDQRNHFGRVKRFYKTEKTLQNVPRDEQIGGGHRAPKSQLGKNNSSLQLFRGITKPVPKGAIVGAGDGRGLPSA